MWRTKELAGQWMDAPAMMRTKSWWNAKMRNEMRRCARMWRCAMEHKDARWNAKMRDGMRRCARTRRCVRTRRCATMRTKRECGKVSWVHDGGVVLWSLVVMSCKIGQYQPVENWVSTAPFYILVHIPCLLKFSLSLVLCVVAVPFRVKHVCLRHSSLGAVRPGILPHQQCCWSHI